MTHFSLVLLAVFIKLFTGQSGVIMFFVSLLGTLTFYHFYYQTTKKLYYTFWTFSSLLVAYLIGQLFSVELNSLFYCYLLALVFVAIEIYILSSPIYYPIVNWWDYDFRFRYDLKVRVELDEEKLDGKLTDLRRGAACIILFDDLKVGTRVNLHTSIENHDFDFELEIMSKRQYSLGRPFHYGVSFKLLEKDKSRDYQRFLSLWRSRYANKKMRKTKEIASDGV